MKTGSYQRYYEKNREEIKAKMRERYALRQQQLQEYLKENPEAVELVREQMRNKYHKRINNQMRYDITQLCQSLQITEAGRAFFHECLRNDKYIGFTPKMINTFREMYASRVEL